MRIVKSLTVTAVAGLLSSLAAWGEPVKNWPVSVTTWTPPASQKSGKGVAEQAAPAAQPTQPLPFIGISPCRMIDTRQSSMPPGYGVPSMAAGEVRTFAMIGQNHCTLPPQAKAVSLNVTAVNGATEGYITVYPAGVPPPPIATVVFQRGQNTLNAAIVPLGDGGGLAVKVSTGLNLVIDVNGYFAPLTGGTQGPAGPPGPPGPQGLQGPQGPPGAGNSFWSASGSSIFYNGGAVGIGPSAPTNLPGVKLDVQAGNIKVDPGFGLVSPSGAQVATGSQGGTFRLIGSPSGPNIAVFEDSQKNVKVAIDRDGGISFGNQKLCAVLIPGNWRSDIVVPSTWAASTCAGMVSKVGATMYALGCIFSNGITYGGANGGIPSPNCGW